MSRKKSERNKRKRKEKNSVEKRNKGKERAFEIGSRRNGAALIRSEYSFPLMVAYEYLLLHYP